MSELTYCETSWSRLPDGEWSQISCRWSRGIDWCVYKLGRKWVICCVFGGNWPLYKTKREAYEAVTNLVLIESHNRAYLRHKAD
jgi:hypothetical protein